MSEQGTLSAYQKNPMALAAAFTASGAAALAYEVSWSRLVTRAVGSGSWGHALTLGVFMLGLGAGYAVASAAPPRFGGKRAYAAVELFIGAWGAVVAWVLPGLSLSPALAASPKMTAVLVLALLLPPTIAMGATLVVATRGLGEGRSAGARAAWLYSANNVGAFVGALLAGAWAVGALGLFATQHGAVALNVLAAAIAMGLHSDDASTATAPSASPRASTERRVPYPLLVAAAVAGAFALFGQSVWIRYFATVLGSSTFSFATVVGATIAGLALGGWAANRIAHGRGSLLVGAAYAAATAALLWWAVSLYASRLPYDFARLRQLFPAATEYYPAYLALRLAACSLLVGIPTAAAGAVAPLLAVAGASRGGDPGRAIGSVFAWNTVGATVAAVVSPPVLLPLMGLSWGATALVLAWLLLAVGLFALSPGPRLRRALPAMSALALLLVIWPPTWGIGVLTAGEFRLRRELPASFDAYVRLVSSGEVVFHRDGAMATVTVVQKGQGRVMRINGKPDASNRGDMLTQVASAHLPLLLAPDAARVAVIGLGSGVTATSAALHSDDVRVVELSPAVVAAAEYFGPDHARPMRDLEIVVGDGRHYLTAEPRQWSVIISEPSNPWVVGNGSLFTVEFFELAKSRLLPGGVLAQWFHLYEMNDGLVRDLLRTVASVFDHVTLWELFPNDVLLLASNEPVTVDRERLMRAFRDDTVRQDLARVQIHSPEALLSLQMLSEQAVRRLVLAPGRVHRDDRPFLEFEAPRSVFAEERATGIAALDLRAKGPGGSGLELSRWTGGERLRREALEHLFVLHTQYPGAPYEFRQALLKRLVDESEVEYLVDVLFTLTRESRWGDAGSVAAALAERAPQHPRALFARAHYGESRPEPNSPEQVHELLSRCVRAGDDPLGRCQAWLDRAF